MHFASGLRSFEDSIKGLRHLLDIVNATHNRQSRMVFCSSLASVLNASPGVVRETPSTDPLSATSVGYSRSKWVAEQVCLNAHRAGTNVYIMRLGQLCGSSVTGQWNETEGWPLLIRTAQTTGSLPLLKDVTQSDGVRPRSSGFRILLGSLWMLQPGLCRFHWHQVAS